ncbi:MAG: hypothetical protein WCD63_24210 [Terrimicrobiaceae bacterium]
MIGPEFREALEGFVNRRLGEDLCAVMGIGRHKVDRIPLEKPLETAQTLEVAAVCDRRKNRKNFSDGRRPPLHAHAFA